MSARVWREVGKLVSAAVVAILALALFAPASAQQSPARLNYEYQLIVPPQPTPTAERIEVIEFFWYGCPYCNQLQPSLEAWLKRKPQDVDLRRIPAIFRESWVPHARLFYTVEALGELDRLHQAVYRAYHIEGQNPNTADSSADWASHHGIDRARWLAAYNAPETTRKVALAAQQTRNYGIQGTPSLVVDGRYLTSTGMSETVPGVIAILDDLIAVVREQRRRK
ncbi:MAG TPA: thiol:disulfide interchange protein DsbA/DsbL [Burkholderiales bacterium]|nr:thiol:disulfide interchange protein DsbA/DsbL [Burkholderiales bacterium]